MLSKARIAISGKSGCGNTTVSRLVGDKLGLRVINYTFKDMAREMGVTFAEICELAEQDPKYDKQLDERQIALAKSPGIVLGSRLAIWLIERADLKVYLFASAKVRARRIAKREKADFGLIYQKMMKRDRRDRERYIRLYQIDNDDYDFADLILDTDSSDQYEVTNRIVEELENKLASSKASR
jgi:cytidylate kinase